MKLGAPSATLAGAVVGSLGVAITEEVVRTTSEEGVPMMLL